MNECGVPCGTGKNNFCPGCDGTSLKKCFYQPASQSPHERNKIAERKLNRPA
jgi:hypothetical protein